MTREAFLQGAPSLDRTVFQNAAGSDLIEFWSGFVEQTSARLRANPDYQTEMWREYGSLSLFEFFKRGGWSDVAIGSLAALDAIEPMLARSFLEMLQVELQWIGSAMVQIEGGMDCLPNAFVPALKPSITFGAEVVALDYTPNSVTIHYRAQGGLQQVTGDFAILAIPFSILRFIDITPAFSVRKQLAIRQLHYSDAIKVMLQCQRRFWEEDDGIFGGVSVTDAPNRLVYYPDHGRATGKGVLMGLYTYGEEANRWAALPPEARVDKTVHYVARLHPQINREFEHGYAKVWGEDRFAGGAFAFFEAGQQERLFHDIAEPEGPVYFAGEHASLKHMWIEGAVESALRAARAIHSAPRTAATG
jgi:monoamine oxidase